MLFQNSPLKRQGWHQGMQKDGRCWLNHQLHGGLKRLRPAILQWQHLEMIQVAIHYSKMAHWKARAGIKECKRMADAGSITNFIVGWKVEASLLCGGSWAALEPKWRNAKKWFAHLPWACLHMAQGRAPFQRLCPHPRHLWSNDQWLWIRTTWIMAALQKPEQISTDFTYNLKITIK